MLRNPMSRGHVLQRFVKVANSLRAFLEPYSAKTTYTLGRAGRERKMSPAESTPPKASRKTTRESAGRRHPSCQCANDGGSHHLHVPRHRRRRQQVRQRAHHEARGGRREANDGDLRRGRRRSRGDHTKYRRKFAINMAIDTKRVVMLTRESYQQALRFPDYIQHSNTQGSPIGHTHR